jgi:HD-GYP domain-containing protein (c-di-GMP phosphodiesterase class II)
VLAEGAAVAGLALEHAETRLDAEATLRATVEAMGVAVALRDQYTADHSREVVDLACETGRRLLLDERALRDLEFAALLHDVGKLGMPDAILHKPGPLDDDEWVVVRRHPLFGERLLRDIPGLERVALIVRSEHERIDGDGYPDGLKGDEIPIESRIILTCDAYEAMTSDRPYRPAMTQDEALKELGRSAGKQLDPDAVEALTVVLSEAGSGRAPEFLAER